MNGMIEQISLNEGLLFDRYLDYAQGPPRCVPRHPLYGGELKLPENSPPWRGARRAGWSPCSHPNNTHDPIFHPPPKSIAPLRRAGDAGIFRVFKPGKLPFFEHVGNHPSTTLRDHGGIAPTGWGHAILGKPGGGIFLSYMTAFPLSEPGFTGFLKPFWGL